MVVPSNLLMLSVTGYTNKSSTEIPQKFQVPSIASKNSNGLTFPWLVLLAAQEEIQHRKERNPPGERTHQDESEKGTRAVSYTHLTLPTT